MRRSREEIYNIYLEYVTIDKNLSNAAIGRTLNVSSSMVTKFRAGFIPPTAANPKPSWYYNDLYAGKIDKPTTLTIVNNMPLKEQIIMNLKSGASVKDIAIHLDLTPKSVAIVKAHAGLDNNIKPEDSNSDMSFEDIGYALGIDESEVLNIYRSGLGKLFTLIDNISALKLYMEDDIPSEFRNTGESMCARRCSTMD